MCCGQIAEDKEVYIITCFSVMNVIMLKKKKKKVEEREISPVILQPGTSFLEF